PTVRVASQAWAKIDELLLSMEMTERDGGMSALELRLANVASDTSGSSALAFDDDAIFKLGAAIKVCAGDETAPREIFQGIITATEAEFPVDGPPALTVLAEDAFQRARMHRRTKVRDHLK